MKKGSLVKLTSKTPFGDVEHVGVLKEVKGDKVTIEQNGTEKEFDLKEFILSAVGFFESIWLGLKGLWKLIKGKK